MHYETCSFKLDVLKCECGGELKPIGAVEDTRKGIIVVVYIERSLDLIRIISARKATKQEIGLFVNFKNGKSKWES